MKEFIKLHGWFLGRPVYVNVENIDIIDTAFFGRGSSIITKDGNDLVVRESIKEIEFLMKYRKEYLAA